MGDKDLFFTSYWQEPLVLVLIPNQYPEKPEVALVFRQPPRGYPQATLSPKWLALP